MRIVLIVSVLWGVLHANTPYANAKVELLTQTTKSWDGNKLPSYNQGEPQITIKRITIAPKTKLAMHLHPVINAGVVLSGELHVVTKSGKELYLKAGDTIVEVVNRWHYGENLSDQEAVIVVFYAGVVGTPDTIVEKH